MTAPAAPAELTVEVTADDIRLGVPQDNCECPVALALKRIPGITEAWVEFGAASITYGRDSLAYDLTLLFPPEAADFIEAFDRGYSGEPFTFTASVQEDS